MEFSSPVSALLQSWLKYVCALDHCCGPFPAIMGRLVLLLWYVLSVLLHCFSCWREDCGQGRNLEPLVLFLERSCPVYVALALIQQGSHGPGLRDCQSSGETWSGWGLELGMGKTIAVNCRCLTLRVGCYCSITAGMGSLRDMCHASSFKVQQLRIKT